MTEAQAQAKSAQDAQHREPELGQFVEKVGAFLEELGMDKRGARHPPDGTDTDGIIQRFADWCRSRRAENS